MWLSRILLLPALALCLAAQAPPSAPLPATPVAPSTPVAPAPVGPEGVTLPLEIVPPNIIPAEKVVIQVGDIKITSAQIDQILQVYPENQRVYANGPGRTQFIDQVVRVLLLSEEGKRRKLDRSELYKTQLMYSAAGILSSQTDAEVKRQAHDDVAALRAYYEAHKSEYDQIHARHILIRMQGSSVPLSPGQKDLTEAEALAKAQEIRQKLVQGADFAEVARAESFDYVSSPKGGDLGFLKRGQTMPSFDEAAFALPVGEISQPVKSIHGFHIVKVEERATGKTFEELRPELEKIVESAASRKLVEDLKARTKVAIDPDFAETPKPVLGPR